MKKAVKYCSQSMLQSMSRKRPFRRHSAGPEISNALGLGISKFQDLQNLGTVRQSMIELPISSSLPRTAALPRYAVESFGLELLEGLGTTQRAILCPLDVVSFPKVRSFTVLAMSTDRSGHISCLDRHRLESHHRWNDATIRQQYSTFCNLS